MNWIGADEGGKPSEEERMNKLTESLSCSCRNSHIDKSLLECLDGKVGDKELINSKIQLHFEFISPYSAHIQEN